MVYGKKFEMAKEEMPFASAEFHPPLDLFRVSRFGFRICKIAVAAYLVGQCRQLMLRW